MNSNSILGSSLAFVVKNGKDIREIAQFIRSEAQKENCSEPEITIISTAVSEVCRKLMEYTGILEITIIILSYSGGIELRGKAHIPEAPRNIDWDTVLQSLNAYFHTASIQMTEAPHSLNYSFHKRIPGAFRPHTKLRF